MSAVHQEDRFEAAIEDWLLNSGGWAKGSKANYDHDLDLDPVELMAFVRDSQPKEWSALVTKLMGEAKAETTLLERIAAELDARGSLDVLRHGVRVAGEQIRLVIFRPTSGITPELVERYEKNRLTVVRQLMYSTKTTDELDLAFFVNGIPTHDAELKNALTGQTVEHAKAQYRRDRDPRERFFAKRSLVHFAVDTDEVYVATLLEGEDTAFVPFNLGHDGGAGNPPATGDGYATSYLWEQIWQRDAWLQLLQRFLHVSETEIEGRRRRQVFFPRYHQWDVVQRLVADARVNGAGLRYLIEHSAGSGKSNSIAWLAYSLMNLHDDADHPVFDKVVVVSDRRNLDKQLRDTIRGFEHKPGIVEAAEHDSKELAKFLDAPEAKVVVTTLWKFPVIVERAQLFRDRRYAVIIDEAHSSQTGEAAAKLKLALGTETEEEKLKEAAAAEEKAAEQDDPEQHIARLVAARGQQKNLSYFAFTATPKGKTLELFGREIETGKYQAFHRYTMRQAIEEGFILDVLAAYTTYEMYYRVAKKSQDDPELPKRKGSAALARFVSLHERQFAEKAEVITEHFRLHTQPKLGGKAKAMWVTPSRLHAVRSYFALKAYTAQNGYNLGVLVAFSGEIVDGGQTYTEAGINKFSEGKLPDEFVKDGYHILVVAEKYQTGYDEPLLHTMFVDKKLEHLKAVQTLSRLNRKIAGKDDTFVLDFVNDEDRIQGAFEPYFEGAETTATDPALLDNALTKLDGFGVIDDADVDGLIAILAKPKANVADHAKLYRLLDPAVERFKKLSEDQQADFTETARHFARLYSFLGQILAYTDEHAEKRYHYVKALLTKLPQKAHGRLDLGDRVLLTHLRLEKTGDHDLSLTHGAGEVPGFRGDGSGRQEAEEEKDRLSELIRELNDRFGTNLGKADQLSLQGIVEDMSEDDDLVAKAEQNNEQNFRFAFDKKFEPAVLDRYEANEALFGKIFADPDFAESVRRWAARELFERARAMNAVTESQPL